MLNAAIIKKLKQVNVCRDAEKSKDRIKESYESASRAGKQEMIALSGQNRNSFYRAERTGSASAKIVLPLAQVSGVSPYWIIGVEDEKGGYDLETVKKFLEEFGYGGIAAELQVPEKKRTRKPRTPKAPEPVVEALAETADEQPQTPEEEVVAPPVKVLTVTISDSQQMREAVEGLDLESASQLLTALFLRAKAGGEAQQLCEAVKYCLLS